MLQKMIGNQEVEMDTYHYQHIHQYLQDLQNKKLDLKKVQSAREIVEFRSENERERERERQYLKMFHNFDEDMQPN